MSSAQNKDHSVTEGTKPQIINWGVLESCIRGDG